MSAQAPSLERRVQALEDREAIRDLVPAYGLAIDDRDFDRLGTLFCTDGAFDNGLVRAEGRDGVVRFYRETLTRHGPTFHYAHTHLVELTAPDEATGVVTAHAELALRGEAFVVALNYLDRYRREQGAWGFLERRLEMLYAMRLTDLPTGLGSTLRLRWPDTAPAEAQRPEPLETWQRYRESVS